MEPVQGTTISNDDTTGVALCEFTPGQWYVLTTSGVRVMDVTEAGVVSEPAGVDSALRESIRTLSEQMSEAHTTLEEVRASTEERKQYILREARKVASENGRRDDLERLLNDTGFAVPQVVVHAVAVFGIPTGETQIDGQYVGNPVYQAFVQRCLTVRVEAQDMDECACGRVTRDAVVAEAVDATLVGRLTTKLTDTPLLLMAALDCDSENCVGAHLS